MPDTFYQDFIKIISRLITWITTRVSHMTVRTCPSAYDKVSIIVYLPIDARYLNEQLLDGSVHTIGGTIRMDGAVIQQPHKKESLADEMAVGYIL